MVDAHYRLKYCISRASSENNISGRILRFGQKPRSMHFGKQAVPLAITAKLVSKAKTTKYTQKAEPFLALPFIF
jgi:hypothetical protein